MDNDRTESEVRRGPGKKVGEEEGRVRRRS